MGKQVRLEILAPSFSLLIEISCEGETMTYKYEFVFDQDYETFKKRCQELGKDDWELASTLKISGGAFIAIFKKYIAP